VIFLDHRIIEQISTRRLRVVKYRGTTHGTNEYPFLIDEEGITVLPVTSLGLSHPVSNERVSSGVKELDEMLGGKGYFRGSSVLVSGTAGTGKTSLSAHFVDAACRRGERCLYFAFEESPNQIIRNMRSIGINLEPWLKSGRLIFHAARPTLFGLETHLATIHKHIRDFNPDAVVIDPISNLMSVGQGSEVNSMLLRLVDLLKSRQITAFLVSLTSGGTSLEGTELGVSSLMDTWLLLRDIELNGERNRGLYVLKSRGMSHSNQIREFLLTEHGIRLINAYLGPSGVLTGSSRLAQEAKERVEAMTRQMDVERKKLELQRKREAMEAEIAARRAAFTAEETQLLKSILQEEQREQRVEQDRSEMAVSRKGDTRTSRSQNGKKAGKR
jgi:circadian clock protein KaiC